MRRDWHLENRFAAGNSVHSFVVALACLGLAAAALNGRASADEALVVPNGSFESPATPFVSLLIGSWQRTPKPDWYVEEGGFQWGQLTGIFLNTSPGAADHIAGLDGQQAAWLFAVPEAGLYGRVRDASGTRDAVFEAGRAYRLSIDVLGAGGNMLDGVELEASLFRWVNVTNRITVAGQTITNLAAVFASRNEMKTYTWTLPTVKESDPWAGQAMGVQVISRATQSNQGGYWDIDRVRVEALDPHVPVVVVERLDGDLRLVWRSARGWRYRVREAGQLGTWTASGASLVGDGGELSVRVPVGEDGQRFYSLLAERVE